jgi:hypothetical protein
MAGVWEAAGFRKRREFGKRRGLESVVVLVMGGGLGSGGFRKRREFGKRWGLESGGGFRK